MPAQISVDEIVILASTDGLPRYETGGRYLPLMHVQQKLQVAPYVWDSGSLSYIPQEPGLTDAQLRATALPVSLGVMPTAGGKTLTHVPVAQGAAGTLELAAADATKKHKVLGCVLTLSAAGSLKFVDSVGDVTGAMDVAASGGFVLPTSLLPYLQTGAINRSLSIVTTVGAARGIVILLTEA